MIAVLLPPGPSSKMHGLDAEQSLSLLPLGDRPILQHIIESLVAQGITSIELIVGHAPEKVEALLGNGDRWGCTFKYHLAAQADRPYRSLKVIARTKTEPWVLIHADRYPCITFPAVPVASPTLYCRAQAGPAPQESAPDLPAPSLIDDWGGTAVFPAGAFGEALSDQTPDEVRAHLKQMVCAGGSAAIAVPEWIDATSPEALLETQTKLLTGKLDGLMISGVERQPGVWVARNVKIDPTAKLTAPLYIGPNCRINRHVRLGPDAVIGASCIVDSNTAIDRSLAMAGSYIGEGLELSNTIVNHGLLVNVRLGARIDVAEDFLLGGVERKDRQTLFGRAAQSLLAALMILVFSPLSLLSLLYFAIVRRLSYGSVEMAKAPVGLNVLASPTYALLCLGADAWTSHRPAGWSAFVRQFLPGLFAVAGGRLSLVGLPPRSPGELQRLPLDWRALYRQGRAGLITEASLAAMDEEDETQLYLADAYYSARRSWLHDIGLVSQYILRLAAPSRRRRS